MWKARYFLSGALVFQFICFVVIIASSLSSSSSSFSSTTSSLLLLFLLLRCLLLLLLLLLLGYCNDSYVTFWKPVFDAPLMTDFISLLRVFMFFSFDFIFMVLLFGFSCLFGKILSNFYLIMKRNTTFGHFSLFWNGPSSRKQAQITTKLLLLALQVYVTWITHVKAHSLFDKIKRLSW